MPTSELLTAADVAQVLGTTAQAIRNALHSGREGLSIPPSIKIGRRRRWMRSAVYAWLHDKAGIQEPVHGATLGTTKTLPQIFRGQVYTATDGDFTVVELDLPRGHAIIETAAGHQGVMSLADLLSAIRSGELSRAA